jgi:hypothetical protein
VLRNSTVVLKLGGHLGLGAAENELANAESNLRGWSLAASLRSNARMQEGLTQSEASS